MNHRRNEITEGLNERGFGFRFPSDAGRSYTRPPSGPVLARADYLHSEHGMAIFASRTHSSLELEAVRHTFQNAKYCQHGYL
jgi:hypothetical protein